MADQALPPPVLRKKQRLTALEFGPLLNRKGAALT